VKTPRTPLRVLNYAVNGQGLGHLTRLLAINRQLRRLATLLDIPTEILFLTSSEADTLVYQHDFPAFKIPSKSVVAACGMDANRYRKVAKQWVWNAVNLCSPDILIVDTFPAGSFHELYDILDFGSKNVFIYRAVRPEAAMQPAFRSALKGYHLILMPQEGGENASPVPDEVRDRVVTTGEIMIRSSVEVLQRDEARDVLGISADALAVYVSTGGGGDAAAEVLLAKLVEAACGMPAVDGRPVHFIVGAGALYRGREFRARNVSWVYRHGMMEYFRAFDAALTAGGFNSVWELMHCGVPCVFLPQPRSHDDQHRRVARCVEAGAGILLETLEPTTVRDTLARLLAVEANRRASRAAAALAPVNHAQEAAEEILSLMHDRNRVEEAGLLADPVFLSEAWKKGLAEPAVLRGAHLFWQRLARPLDEDSADEVLQATASYLQESQRLGMTEGKAFSALRKVKPDVDLRAVAEQAVALMTAPAGEETT
jgi:UDP-N-acetylglucosamine--N-acetylmuramyl-(pentapeptide) pyrophosphoryl-undecaprenol N-acetylglucosamine transferase